MTSIDDLLAKLKALEQDLGENKLEHISFEKSFNKSFGLEAGKPEDYTVLLPFNTWPTKGSESAELKQIHQKQYPSALQDAFKQVLERGLKEDPKNCFIDMASLSPGVDFFNFPQDKNLGKDIALLIKSAVTGLPAGTIPVIRFIAGTENLVPWMDPTKPKDFFHRDTFRNIFWPDGKPLMGDLKAKLYVGYYRPSFVGANSLDAQKYIAQVAKKLQATIDGLKQIAEFAPTVGKAMSDFLKKIDIAKLADGALKDRIRSASWNHGKVLAVNGRAVMTGGGNYWYEYTSAGTNEQNIVDHQAKVVGDAAISAHRWADYFWKYLNDIPRTDDLSFAHSADLDKPFDDAWTDQKAPMAPESVLTPRFADTQKLPALTVGRLGDWHGDMNALNYPVQVVDAARDLFLNLVFQYTKDMKTIWPDADNGFSTIVAYNTFADDTLTLKNTLGINPNAWASRLTRVQAIANAKRSVVICQQMLVDTLPMPRVKPLKAKENGFYDMVQSANEQFSLTGKNAWDGFIWPFDHLLAIAYAITRMENDNVEDAKVQIVLTTSQPGARADWDDRVPIAEIKNRVKIILKGMTWLPWALGRFQAFGDVTVIKHDQVDKVVDKRLEIRRVLNNKDFYCHCKVVCVDDKLMYVGSDNVYPSYNEEHGIWIEDGDTIQAWKKKFWTEMWDRATKTEN